MFLVLLAASSLSALAQDAPAPAPAPPVELATVNREALSVLGKAEPSESAREQAVARLNEVFANPERLARVPSREEVGRYWQAQGLAAVHGGGDAIGPLRQACLLEKTAVKGVELSTFYDLWLQACAKRPPALVPLELGEMSGIAVVWVDGKSHGVGQYVRSGYHLVQVTEDEVLRSSRWARAVAPPPPEPEPPAVIEPVTPPVPVEPEPPEAPPQEPLVEAPILPPVRDVRACEPTCRGLRIGGVSALVVSGGLAALATQSALEIDERDEDGWGDDDREDVVLRRNLSIVGASVLAGAGATGILLSGRF